MLVIAAPLRTPLLDGIYGRGWSHSCMGARCHGAVESTVNSTPRSRYPHSTEALWYKINILQNELKPLVADSKSYETLFGMPPNSGPYEVQVAGLK